MQKGKKFNAAEKYFHEKEIKYQKQIKQKCETIVQMNDLQSELIHEKQELQTENEQLKEWIERLLKYTELTKEDIQKACEQDKKRGDAMVNFSQLITAFTKQYL